MAAFTDPSQRVHLSQAAFATLIERETMVMDIEQGRYVVLNDIASNIWSQLSQSDTGITVGEVVRHLEEQYEADPGVIAAEVATFLAKLEERSLISSAKS